MATGSKCGIEMHKPVNHSKRLKNRVIELVLGYKWFRGSSRHLVA
jgi:hypothetical protein